MTHDVRIPTLIGAAGANRGKFLPIS